MTNREYAEYFMGLVSERTGCPIGDLKFFFDLGIIQGRIELMEERIKKTEAEND